MKKRPFRNKFASGNRREDAIAYLHKYLTLIVNLREHYKLYICMVMVLYRKSDVKGMLQEFYYSHSGVNIDRI